MKYDMFGGRCEVGVRCDSASSFSNSTHPHTGPALLRPTSTTGTF